MRLEIPAEEGTVGEMVEPSQLLDGDATCAELQLELHDDVVVDDGLGIASRLPVDNHPQIFW